MHTNDTRNSIKAIIFDWGGVLSEHSPHESSFQLSSQLAIPYEQAKALVAVGSEEFKRGRITEDEFWAKLEQAHGQPIPHKKRNIWLDWEGLRPLPEMVAFISELKEQGYKTAVLSNTFQQAQDAISTNGGYDMFDIVITSPDVGYAKPDPEIYRLTLDKLGVRGSECVFVDDQQKCLTPAKDMFGMQTVLAVTPEQTIADIRKLLS